MATTSDTKKLSKKTEILAGIDFGTTKISVVVGAVQSDGLEIIGIGTQPSLGIRKGVVVNIPTTVEATRKAIEQAELMAGVSIQSVYVGIAGSHIRGFNSVGVVAIKKKEVEQSDIERAIDAAKAVAIPVDREILHIIPQEFTVDDQEGIRDPLGMAGVRLESKVHIVTGALSSAQNIIKCANQAGVAVADLVLEPLASAEAALSEDEKELGAAVIDLGGGTTDIAIFVRGSVMYTGSIALGGHHITNDLAVGLRTSIQDAERIKIESGCAYQSLIGEDKNIEIAPMGGRKTKEVTRAALTKIIEPRVEEIFDLVSREISSSGYKHLLSAGVVVTGGTSQLEGLAELAEFQLELPVRRGIPQGIRGIQDAVQSPVYSTAVGLLLYGMKNREKTNLVTDKENFTSRTFYKVKNWFSELF